MFEDQNFPILKPQRIHLSLDLKSNLKILLTEGKESYVIEYMMSILNNSDLDGFNEAVSIASSINKLKTEIILGVISREDVGISRSRILLSLIELIDRTFGKKMFSSLKSDSILGYKRITELNSNIENDLIGSVVENIEIKGFVDKGGFGFVYKGVDVFTRKLVAIKISRSLNVSDMYIRDIIDLSRRVLKIEPHPNIVSITKITNTNINNESVICHVMEFLEGGNLYDLLHSSKSHGLDFYDKLDLFKKICFAVDFAHNQIYQGELGNTEVGIVHGDIKPMNILLTKEMEPKIADFLLIDFYLIRKQDLDTEKQLLGRRVSSGIGTVEYMAPEQEKEGIINFKTDIYTLGVLLYEILTLRRPNKEMLMENLLSEFREYVSDMTHIKHVSKIISKCLKEDPDQRYESVKHIIKDLNFYMKR